MIKIDFEHTNISSLLKAYLGQQPDLDNLYDAFPEKKNYALQSQRKLQDYKHRSVLVDVLTKQMQGLHLHSKQQDHLKALSADNTVTITTGHQLNLLTGPLYFIYKILHTVKICDELNSEQSDIHYVPIYWMATEDHDFQEINHFNTYQENYSYSANEGGYVGDIASHKTEETFLNFFQSLPDNKFSQKLKSIIEKAYFQELNLAKATRILVHELLGSFGILILDANDRTLKACMHSIFTNELQHTPNKALVEQANHQLEKYKTQAHARPINLFYLNNNRRERIEKYKDGYQLVESGKTFSSDRMMEELHQYPEKFSPNVILRPLYQEVILPNVAYIGGGGELAYWLQLKGIFDYNQIAFPMLVLRNSMLILPNAVKHKLAKYNLLSNRLFEPKHLLKQELVENQSHLFEALDKLRNHLESQFIELKTVAENTTDSFGQMVQAQKKKQLNGFDKMYQRLNQAEQKRFNTEMDKIDSIFDYTFPRGNWQERVINFSQYYVKNGDGLFQEIYNAMQPFDSGFNILCLDSIAEK